MANKIKRETKLKKILRDRSLFQNELRDLIVEKYPNVKPIQLYRINKIVNGVNQNIALFEALRIAKSLDLTIDEIIEDDIDLNPKKVEKTLNS